MNKKVLVFVTIFALLIGIGVGYALVTQDLNIDGGITSADNNELVKNLKVQFENTKFTEVSKLENGAVSDAIHTETDSVLSCSFAVSMKTKGSYAEYTNNIINNSDQYAAKLTYTVETSTGENVEELSNGVYQIGDYYKITIKEYIIPIVEEVKKRKKKASKGKKQKKQRLNIQIPTCKLLCHW